MKKNFLLSFSNLEIFLPPASGLDDKLITLKSLKSSKAFKVSNIWYDSSPYSVVTGCWVKIQNLFLVNNGLLNDYLIDTYYGKKLN